MKKMVLAAVTACLLLLLPTTVLAHWADSYCTALQEKQIMFGDEQGFRADDPLLRCEFAAMLNRAFSFSSKNSADMPDVTRNDWYYNDCAVLFNAGVMTGDAEGNINPNQIVTRAEMAVMLSRTLGLPAGNRKSPDPSDVADWAYGSVKILTEMELVSGYPDGTFRGENPLSRGEAAVVLAKALEAGSFSGGNGSVANPYRITKTEQFAFIQQDLTASYRLMCDIEFDEIAMPVIGSEKMPFNGVLDGNFHRIIVRKSQGGENVLFGNIGESGMVTRLRFICPETRMAIANVNAGRISLCSNTSFTGEASDYVKQFGGIAFENYGRIEKCYNASSVNTSDDNFIAGGIAGFNKGSIKSSFNTGAVAKDCGGIAGKNDGEITDCYTLSGNPVAQGKGKITNVSGEKQNVSEFKAEGFTNLLLDDNPYMGNEHFELYAGGEGTELNPYRIENTVQFAKISENPDKHFIQMADLTGISTSILKFSGHYNGNGYSMKSIRLKSDANSAVFLENYGTLQNIRVTDAKINASENAAGLVLYNYGTVSACSFSGTLSASRSAGLVFQNFESGAIFDCYTSGTAEAGAIAAGFVYQNDGLINNAYSAAEVLAYTTSGLVHQNNGLMQAVYFAGNLAENGSGLVHRNVGQITYGYTFVMPVVGVNEGKTEYTAFASETQMQNPEMYYGFNFLDAWESDEYYGYPTLRKMPHLEVIRKENFSDFAGGDGSVNNPYKIVTPQQLSNIQKYPEANFILMNDLNVASIQAVSDGAVISDAFYGELNGNKKQIFGFSSDKALFNKNYGSISDLYIKDGVINGENAASLVYINYGSVTGCMFGGSITAEKGAGLVYTNPGQIDHCMTEGEFKGTILSGIAFCNDGTIENCSSVVRMQGDVVYGITQNDKGSITDCWFGGYLIGAEYYPLADKNVKNAYYLNYYGKTEAEAKSIDSLSEKPLRLGDSWQIADGYPFLKNMPKPQVALFDMQGDGSVENPYQIRRAEQLKYLGMYPDKAFCLVQNIHADELILCPVEIFSGTLDGNGKTIENLTVLGKQAGLVATLEGKITNLTLRDVMIEGSAQTGAFVAVNSGVLENCTVKSGRIGTSGDYAGGICGQNAGDGLLYNCENGADVFSAHITGGVVGVNEGTTVLCKNIGGAVTTAKDKDAVSGGIAGSNPGVIDRSYNNGKVFAYSESESAYSGGIAGRLQNSVSNAYNTGEIHAKSQKTAASGGIAGRTDDNAVLRACYNTGFTNVTATQAYAGSAAGVAMGGELNGFVYENTVAEPVGFGALREKQIRARDCSR